MSKTVASPLSTSSVEDSPARISPAQAQARVLLEVAADFGMSLHASSGSSGQLGLWSKTSPAEPSGGSTQSELGWQTSDMRRYRSLCQQRLSEHLTSADGSSLLPTPTVGDAKASGSRQSQGSKAKPGVSLTDVVVHNRTINETHGPRLPTPAARDYKGPTQHRDPSHGKGLPDALGQKGRTLNPLFVLWMMGFPPSWFEGVVHPEDSALWRSGTR